MDINIKDLQVLKFMDIAKDLTMFALKGFNAKEDLIIRTYKRILDKLLEGE